MRDLKNKIIQLHNEGKSYRDIEKILECSKSLISFHCGMGQKARFNKRNVENRREKKAILVKMLGGRCQVCGYDKCLEALDFHHKNESTKKVEISYALRMNFEIAKKEIEKCELLCANCHREKHAAIDKFSPESVKRTITRKF